MVQGLHEKRHYVILFTARWEADRETTVEWLKAQEVPYDELVMGKPRADIYIDDRALGWPCSPGALFNRLWGRELASRRVEGSTSGLAEMGREMCPHCGTRHDPHLACTEVRR